MRNRVFTLTMLVGLLVSPLYAQGQKAAVPGKVGVVNMQQAISESAEGKKAIADIQKKYQPKRDDLQRQQQEIASLQDQLQKQAATLSDEERLRLNRELEDKQKLFKRASEDANADFQADNQDVIRRIGQKMVRVINDYAQQNGYALIVDDAQLPVYYVDRNIDLTEQIIKLYDAAYPLEAAATQGGAAASTAAKPSSAASKPTNPPKP
jgi:outer membrane protein